MVRRVIVGLQLVFISIFSFSQVYEYPYQIPEYNFIHYDENKIEFFGDSSEFENFFYKYDSINFFGKGKLNIVHFGGSHIQADIYTHRLRHRLQTFMPGANGGRGLVFPYRIAKTNNPGNYRVQFTGEWDYCKNTQRKKLCTLGVMGIAGYTRDSSATITIAVNADSTDFYDFNKVRIYTSLDSNSFLPVVNPNNIASKHFDYRSGVVEYELKRHVDSLYFSLEKTDSIQDSFTLYGFELLNDDPGVVYNAIGVNGASLPSYLRCQLFEEQLSIVNPDLVVISIGTNDGNTRNFNSDYYKANYDSLIQKIKNASPETAILLTVPNDSYLYRKYINKNTAKIEKVIIELAKEYNCGVWDFYKIMGGLNSIYVWQREGLAKYDKIHFNYLGYMLKGDLLFNAILKSYDNHLELIKK